MQCSEDATSITRVCLETEVDAAPDESNPSHVLALDAAALHARLQDAFSEGEFKPLIAFLSGHGRP